MGAQSKEILASAEAGERVIRGSLWRLIANIAGALVGVGTAALLLHHLGRIDTGRYVTVISLIAIPVTVSDVSLNVVGSRELALCSGERRRALTANILGQRLIAMPLSIALALCFSLAAGYSSAMVFGTLLAGAGALLVAIANVFLLRLTVELRNAGLAFVDFFKQAFTLVAVGLLVALGAQLTAFFAILIAVGLGTLALVPVLAGLRAFLVPRFDAAAQRRLLASALPLAGAMALGQVYFRFVIILMSLISSGVQTGYFAGSLRAVEAGMALPILVAGVAQPLLAHAAREDRQRLRYAVRGLSEGLAIAGALVVIVAVHAAEPVMSLIGGAQFRPAGAVLRIQVGALFFVALDQVWSAALLALGRQRELILTNGLALGFLALCAALLVPPFGALGGGIASVLGEACLGALIYWRLRGAAGAMMVGRAFLIRLAIAAGAASAVLAAPDLPALASATAAGVCFVVVGELIGLVPREVHEALGLDRLLKRGLAKARNGRYP